MEGLLEKRGSKTYSLSKSRREGKGPRKRKKKRKTIVLGRRKERAAFKGLLMG